jgi:hypothetical protein
MMRQKLTYMISCRSITLPDEGRVSLPLHWASTSHSAHFCSESMMRMTNERIVCQDKQLFRVWVVYTYRYFMGLICYLFCEQIEDAMSEEGTSQRDDARASAWMLWCFSELVSYSQYSQYYRYDSTIGNRSMYSTVQQEWCSRSTLYSTQYSQYDQRYDSIKTLLTSYCHSYLYSTVSIETEIGANSCYRVLTATVPL